MADLLDSDMGVVFDAKGNELKVTPYFEDYLYNIISTLGGEGSTIIGDIINTVIAADKLDYTVGLVKQLLIDTQDFNGKIKTANYTAKNKEWIEARTKATISLPGNPLRNHQVIVSNGDGSTITISGNGNNIKYTSTDTSLITKRKGTSLHFHYFIDNVASESYWRVI